MKKYINLPFLFGGVLGVIALYFTTGNFKWGFCITFILGSVIGGFILNQFSKNHNKD
ncbi:hypothetical protein ACFQZ1_10465 [Bacillus sp. CGMCC 1.60114]|uniref:hypothetical protein n=1 Tax=unclassified Bacillus (in: firmicutes) TaxID=185979 RepID=UPI00362D1C83